MPSTVGQGPDVLQVCRNGHVITDLLRARPELGRSHCDRCGAATLSACPTCGQPLPGARAVPGLETIGKPRPPSHCEKCGAAFPWAEQARPPEGPALADLVTLLERLPRTIRELRVRHDDRSPFRVEDEKDLEDLLRALLPLRFDDVRPRLRTPSYAAGTRTDFLLAAEEIVVAVKLAQRGQGEAQLREQVHEDVAHYCRERSCRVLVVLVYDPERLLHRPQLAPLDTSALGSELEVRCVVAPSSRAP